MGATSKKALDSADHTVVHKHMEYTVLPMQDASAMLLYDKKLDWNKLDYVNKDEQDDYMVLNSQEWVFVTGIKQVTDSGGLIYNLFFVRMIGGIDNMKDVLVKPLNMSVGDNVSLEARLDTLVITMNALLISLS